MKQCKVCGVETLKIAKGKCNKCYQQERYIHNREIKIKTQSCHVCSIKVNEYNDKGTKIKKLVKGYCNSCYYKTFLSPKTKQRVCKDCGIEFIAKKVIGYCTQCKKNHLKRKVNKTLPTRSDIDPQLYQDMLTLFRRYRDGLSTPVDAFKVIDVYLRIFEGYPFIYNSQIDTYSEESQIVMMLKSLKKVHDNQ